MGKNEIQIHAALLNHIKAASRLRALAPVSEHRPRYIKMFRLVPNFLAGKCMQCVFLSQFCAFYGLLLMLNYYHGSENSSSVRQFIFYINWAPVLGTRPGCSARFWAPYRSPLMSIIFTRVLKQMPYLGTSAGHLV